MRSYKYRIVRDEKWHFELLPNNSNRQYVARSNDYESKGGALEGICKLKAYLNSNPEIDVREYVFQVKGQKTYCKGFMFYRDEHIYTRKYIDLESSNEGLQNILLHYNSSLRSDLNVL